MTSYLIPLVLIGGGLAACGDNLPSNAERDAGDDGPDGGDDAMPGACTGGHAEDDDAANDQAIESSGETVTAGGAAVICGRIDARAPVDDIIDDDLYSFELATAASLKVTIRHGDLGTSEVIGAIYTNPFGTEPEDFGFLSGGQLGAGGLSLFTAPSCFNHPACQNAALPAGTYTLILEGTGAAAPGAAIPYEVTIEAYDPETDCATPATAGFTEALDVVAGNPNDDSEQNDVFGPGTGLPVTAWDDAPEASGLTIAQTSYRADGVATSHETSDGYLDRDVYEIHTGPDTNALDIKVTWTGAATDDFDWMLAQPAAADPLTTPPTFIAIGGSAINPEFGATPVEPDTTYWLWVGAYGGTAVDTAYQITVCGSEVSP